MLNAFLDLVDGMPLIDCSKKYGRDFIIHYNHIKSLLLDSGYLLCKGVFVSRGDIVEYSNNLIYEVKHDI